MTSVILTVYPVNGEHLQDCEYEDDEPASVVVDEGEDKLTALEITLKHLAACIPHSSAKRKLSTHRRDISQPSQEHDHTDPERHLGLVPLGALVAHYRYYSACKASY